MTYRAVVFDLWGTLAHPFPGDECEQALQTMARIVGVRSEEFLPRWNRDTWRQRATGAFPTIEANIASICEQSNVCASPQQLAEAATIRHTFTRRALRPRTEAAQTLELLTEMGMRIGLISDCSVEVPDLFIATPLARWIAAPIFSCRAGMKKPDPALYRLACEQLGVTSWECIYVADGYSRELKTAEELGMRAILMAPPGETPGDTSDWEGADWTGLRIADLLEVCDFLKHDATNVMSHAAA